MWNEDSGHNLLKIESDIQIFVREYKERIHKQLAEDEGGVTYRFLSFAEQNYKRPDPTWIAGNIDRFFKDFYDEENIKLNFLSEQGSITALVYSPDGEHIIVGHTTGMIQMRHGVTGYVLTTLRNIQFPPKPVYALEYSRTEERVCYASCTDGAVYRIEIPNIDTAVRQDTKQFCIIADPALDCLTTQYYSTPGVSCYSTPFISQRLPALCLGITADQSRMVVGYNDTSIRVFDMETQEMETTYKVHKLRLQFIPKKLQRMHTGQVCALKCHDQQPNIFASAAWDNTLRIWDTRCPVGCMMTFEGVEVANNSIDINRNHCITGSWCPTEALCLWDLAAHKRLNVVRIQNRRPDVDGEYIYACRYWRSDLHNRKGKYVIIGGSGTCCVEVINLHNRYITCSYPTTGSILALDSFDNRIAFGGTSTVFQIVTFHDPKHEKYVPEVESDFDYTKGNPDLYVPSDDSVTSAPDEVRQNMEEQTEMQDPSGGSAPESVQTSQPA